MKSKEKKYNPKTYKLVMQILSRLVEERGSARENFQVLVDLNRQYCFPIKTPNFTIIGRKWG